MKFWKKRDPAPEWYEGLTPEQMILDERFREVPYRVGQRAVLTVLRKLITHTRP